MSIIGEIINDKEVILREHLRVQTQKIKDYIDCREGNQYDADSTVITTIETEGSHTNASVGLGTLSISLGTPSVTKEVQVLTNLKKI